MINFILINLYIISFNSSINCLLTVIRITEFYCNYKNAIHVPRSKTVLDNNLKLLFTYQWNLLLQL